MFEPSCVFRRAVIACAVVCLSTAAVDAQGRSSREATLIFNTASRLYRQKNWRDASAAFGRFIERFPKHDDADEARFARGYCFNRLGDHAKAVLDLEAARRHAGATWTADAHFYYGRSQEALAVKGGGGATDPRKHWVAAADGYGKAAASRRKAIATLAKKARKSKNDAKRREQLVDSWVLSLSSQGEALYQSGDHAGAIRALATLEAERSADALTAEGYGRGLYFLALAHFETARADDAAKPDDTATLAVLARLTAPEFEREALWADATFLAARLLHKERRLADAIAHYQRVVAKGGATGPVVKAAYYLGVTRYELATPEGYRLAARDLAAFHAAYRSHAFAPRARYYEALSYFQLSKYGEAAKRFDALLADKRAVAGLGGLIGQALLSQGQSHLLSEPPRHDAAVDALARAVERERKAGGAPSAALAQARYWHGEALFARGGDDYGPSAAAFAEVAGPLAQFGGPLAEEAAYKRAVALLRAGRHKDCADAARTYRERYSGSARFRFESFKVAARNALRAPLDALPEAERRAASQYYEDAARFAPTPAEANHLLYLSAVAHHRNGSFSSAETTLRALDATLSKEDRADAKYADFTFYFADSLAQQPAPPEDAAPADKLSAKKRWQRAAGVFAAYLEATKPRHEAIARVNRGLCLQWAGEPRPARDCFRAFVAKFATHDLADRMRFTVANLSLELGEHETAFAEYRAVAAVKRADADLALRALLQGAALARRLSQPDEAVALLDDIAKRRKTGAEVDRDAAAFVEDVDFHRAMALVEGERGDAAADALRAFIDSYPSSGRLSDARLQLAYLLLDRDEPASAIAVLAPLVASDATVSGRDEALYLTGWSHGELAHAADDADAGDDDDDDDDDDDGAGGDDDDDDDDDDDAPPPGEQHAAQMEAAYRQLLAEHPASDFAFDAKLELGQHLFNRDDREDAKELFTSLRQDLDTRRAPPGRAAALRERTLWGLAFVAREEEDHAVAHQLFDAVAINESSELAPTALFWAARSWMLAGENGEAVTRFEKLVGAWKPRAGEQYEESLLRLGECYHREQEYGKAIETLERLLSEFPEGDLRHEGRFALGFALQYKDRSEDAIRELRQVVNETVAVVAARAQYHIGECLMDAGKHREAAAEFLTVVANFDFDGAYRPWWRRALLSAGIAYQAAGDDAAATQQFEELIEAAPESDEAQAAKKRQAEASGGGESP